MRRRAAPALLLLTAAAQPSSTPTASIDINETGRTLATLNDWRAIIFVLVVLLFFQLVERWWSSRDARLERKEMAALARSFAESANQVAGGLNAVQAELLVLRALTSRVESNHG
jgi:hypothetical protein